MTALTTAVLKVSSQAVADPASGSRLLEFLPTGAIAQNYPRSGGKLEASSLAGGSGKEHLVRIRLFAGQVATKIGFVSNTTAATSPTHQWFTLRDSSRNLLRQTSNDTTTAWAGNTAKELTLTSPYTVPADGDYYLGIMVAATTPPTLSCVVGSSAVQGIAPVVSGYDNTNTGLTTTAPATSAALTASGVMPYAYIK